MDLELTTVHHLMFMLETCVWLRLAEGRDDDIGHCGRVLFQPAGGLHELQLRRLDFLYNSASSDTLLPFGDATVDILTQQAAICYTLEPAQAKAYAVYAGLPRRFQMYVAAFREIDMKLGGSVPSSQQLADSLQTVLSSVLDAELCTSDTGVAVPTRWKWRLLKDVDDIEDAQEQQSSGCIAYRMWMALSVDMAPETVADNYLELKLRISVGGPSNAREALLRLRAADVDIADQVIQVCAERGELLTLSALSLPAWFTARIAMHVGE